MSCPILRDAVEGAGKLALVHFIDIRAVSCIFSIESNTW